MSLYCGLIGTQNTILLKFTLHSLFVFVHYLIKHTFPRAGFDTEEDCGPREQSSQGDFPFRCLWRKKKSVKRRPEWGSLFTL